MLIIMRCISDKVCITKAKDKEIKKRRSIQNIYNELITL